MNVFITGTSSGIGYGLATEFLKRGARVWGISRRKPGQLTDHPAYKHCQLDLTRHRKAREEIPQLVSGAKAFDLVALNSGILGEIKLMSETGVEEMKKVMEINVWSNKVLLDILFLEGLEIKQVVGMSSKASLRSTPGWGPYSLSKAGLNMLMNIYAKEYPDTHFSAFAPGLVDSEIQEYIYTIRETDKYPTTKRLQEARYTGLMPHALEAAPRLIAGFRKALGYPSGSFVDVREI